MIKLLPYIVETLEKYRIKYEVDIFDSGAVMIDIWMNDKVYVIQIYEDTIGLSDVTAETGFDIIPDKSFTQVAAFVKDFTSIFIASDKKKTLVINANNFSTLEQFYDEAVAVLTKDLNWKTGHNLDAFNDLLRGGFGVHNYREPIVLIWQNAGKSRMDLSEPTYETLVNIIRGQEHIDLFEC